MCKMKLNTKISGYLIAGIGLIGLALSSMTKLIPNPKYIIIISIILVGVGVVLVMSGSSEKSQIGKEVPIYKGKEIIGYRVIK